MVHISPGKLSPPTKNRLVVAYIGPVDFPSSAANAQRMAGVIDALQLAGCDVIVGSASSERRDHSGLRTDAIVPLAELPVASWPRHRRVWRSLRGGVSTARWLSQVTPQPDVVLLYGTTRGYLRRAKTVCRARGVPLVLDIVEWYESAHLPGGRYGPFSIANAAAMREATKVDGALTISSYLADYYGSRGLPVLRVPPLIRVSAEPSSRLAGTAESLSIAYVGSPGRKDRATVESLWNLHSLLGTDSSRVRVNIAGVSAADAARLIGRSGDTPHPNVFFHGRVSAAGAREIVTASDFTVLQRPDARYAHAGFPTKIAESLCLGTPVMSNLTSDLGEYLVDGVNARVLRDESQYALADAVREQIASRHGFDRLAISDSARKCFDPSSHSARVGAFFHDIVQNSLEHRTT